MEEFSKDRYQVDILKVEIPINSAYLADSKAWQGGESAYDRQTALDHFRATAAVARKSGTGSGSRYSLLRGAVWACNLERRRASIRRERDRWPGNLVTRARYPQHPGTQCHRQSRRATLV